MSKRENFHAVKIPKVNMNLRQDAVGIELEDGNGNIMQVGMTRTVAAQFVSHYQTSFVAIDDQKVITNGATPQELRSFEAEAARILVVLKAYVNPGASPLSAVVVKISPGSDIQQVLGLSVEQAEALAAELQLAASQARQNP